MKVLVLATNYTIRGRDVASHFIHSRNLLYSNNNIEVSVLSFGAEYDYEIDGINVYTLNTYKSSLGDNKYDIVLSHAPNLRNHYRFLIKYSNRFSNIIYFFHGHEVLISSEIYPKPYKYSNRSSILYKLFIEIYDRIKLIVWRNYFTKNYAKSQFIFVSSWMKTMFDKYIKMDSNLLKNRTHIIYNCIGKDFEVLKYDFKSNKDYDFVTIRNILDKSKYGIDIVCRIAENNPDYKFCIIGKGKFFKFNKKPDNVVWVDKNLTHEEIIDFLNRSKCALLPTRADAQGVMACEMATFGIPLITSNIDVCKEVFEEFENVAFIDNDDEKIYIEPIFKELQKITVKQKNEKYFEKNTVGREIELFKKLKG
jgi:glycosyltransferase involved in cell wall biosynthesis